MIFLGADHGGFELKERVKDFLDENEIDFEDLGPFKKDSVDYPDYSFAVGEKVAAGVPGRDKGVMVCTTGLGACVAVNKVKGVRGGMGYGVEAIKKARWDVDINVLCLGGGALDDEQSFEVLKAFLDTPFSDEDRHQRRVDKISDRERE
ncbi:MAG: RpiB/LacA/LacB family sugar-phosphate isomerase [Terriglobia bacterium]